MSHSVYGNGLSYLVGERGQVHAHKICGAEFGGFEAADDVLKSGSDHKVFLLQTQLLALKELRSTEKSLTGGSDLYMTNGKAN